MSSLHRKGQNSNAVSETFELRTFCRLGGGAAKGVASLFSAVVPLPVPFAMALFLGSRSSGLGGPLISPYLRQAMPHVSHMTPDGRFFGPFHQTVDSFVRHDPQNKLTLDEWSSSWPLTTEPSSSGSILDRTETVRRNLVGAREVTGSEVASSFLFSSPRRPL